MEDRISITLLTRNRPDYFIGCFSSLLAQTFKNWDVIIIDDSDEPITHNPVVDFLIKLAQHDGHDVQFVIGEGLGISQAWQRGLEMSEHELGQRLEDDIWIHQDYLKHLYEMILTDNKAGAVGGLSPNAWHFNTIKPDQFKNFFYVENGNLIPEDRQCGFIENPPDRYEVCHLHGLFLYKKTVIQDVGGFGVHMTRVAHRDETDLTLRMWFAGYRLLVCPKAWLRHAEAPGGGSRDEITLEERRAMQEKDEAAFQSRLKALIEKHPDKKLTMRD